MAAGLLVLSALVLGLAPAGGSEADATVGLPAAPGPLGEVAVSADDGGASLSTGLTDPVTVDTSVLPDLPVSLRTGETQASEDGDEAAGPTSSWASAPLQALRDAPPEALFAGSSVLATLLAFAAWFAKPAFGLFSRIEDDALAGHPMRRQALDAIAANPGATLQDLRRILGCSWGTAVYHLGRLEGAGLVAVRRVAGRRGHWPLGQAPARDALAPTGQAFATLVRDHPGLPQNELARLAGVGSPAACKQLARLESAGLVVGQRSGRARLYVPTGSLDAMLAKARPALVATASA